MYHKQYSRDLKSVLLKMNSCEKVGDLFGGKWDSIFESCRRVYSTEGIAPSIVTRCGGGHDAKILDDVVAYDEQNKILHRDGTVGTLTTDGSSPKHNNRIIEGKKVRKITEIEAFRLMGVKDKDFQKIKKRQSASSLYHLAGDSIVTTCLMSIFGEMFENVDSKEKITDLVSDLTVRKESKK